MSTLAVTTQTRRRQLHKQCGESQLAKEICRGYYLNAPATGTIRQPVVSRSQFALLELCSRRSQGITGVFDVARAKCFERLGICGDAAEIEPREIDDSRACRHQPPKVGHEQEQKRPALIVTSRGEFIDGDVGVQHFQSTTVDGVTNHFICAWMVCDGVDGVGIKNYAPHGPASYVTRTNDQPPTAQEEAA